MGEVGVDYGQSWPTHYDNLYCVDTSSYYTYIIAIYYITRVYVYVYICVYVCVWVRMYVYVYMYMHVYIYVYVYAYAYVYVYVCVHTSMYIHK